MKKQLTIIALAAIMLCACGSANQNQNQNSGNNTDSVPAQTEPYDLAFYNLKGNVKK